MTASARGRPAWSKARSGRGIARPAGGLRARQALATRPLKFTLTGPHMLAKTLLDTHYRDKAGARAWRSPTCWPSR